MSYDLQHFPNFKTQFFGEGPTSDCLDLLLDIRAKLSCKHLIHCSIARPGLDPRLPEADMTVTLTTPVNWIQRYSDCNYFETDILFDADGEQWHPSVKGCLLDMHDFTDNNPRMAEMLEDGMRHDIGNMYLIAAYPHPRGTPACCIFTFDIEKREQEAFKRNNKALIFKSLEQLNNLLLSDRQQICINNPLTPREIDCLRWAANGKTDSEIAEILNIARWTVVTYLQNAKTKLGCSNRTSAVATSIAMGIIDAPPTPKYL